MESVYSRLLPSSCKKMDESLHGAVSNSKIGRYFKLEERNSSFTKELRAGTTSFLTMAYVITINVTILLNQTASPDCMLKPNQGYENCIKKIESDLVVAACLSAMIGSFAMGILANLPLGVAPATGASTFLAYNLVGFHGSGSISYGTTMACYTVYPVNNVL